MSENGKQEKKRPRSDDVDAAVGGNRQEAPLKLTDGIPVTKDVSTEMENEPEKKIQDKTVELEKIEDDDDDDDDDDFDYLGYYKAKHYYDDDPVVYEPKEVAAPLVRVEASVSDSEVADAKGKDGKICEQARPFGERRQDPSATDLPPWLPIKVQFERLLLLVSGQT